MALSDFLCFIHQHDRNTLPDRIAEAAGRTDEAGFGRLECQGSFALRADENCDQIRG